MTEVTITVGVSASGKTTWAMQQKAEDPKVAVVCRDDIRRQIMENENKEFTWKSWKWNRESLVTEIFWRQVNDAINDHGITRLIIADTNLGKARRKDLISRLLDMKTSEVKLKFFPVSWEEAVQRDLERQYSVGTSVLARQFEQWYRDCEDIKKYIPVSYLPPAWIFDIDGTLAERHPDRTSYEWDKVGMDLPRNHIIHIAQALHDSGFKIIVLSGRDKVCEPHTKVWLEEQQIPFIRLVMREKDDCRKDFIVKEELFWKHIAPYWKVAGVFDDRPQVCRMWRKIGLEVVQVGNPYIEF